MLIYTWVSKNAALESQNGKQASKISIKLSLKFHSREGLTLGFLFWFWVMKKLRKNSRTVLHSPPATSIIKPQRNIIHVLVSVLLQWNVLPTSLKLCGLFIRGTNVTWCRLLMWLGRVMTSRVILVFMCKWGKTLPPKYTFPPIGFSLILAGNLANCQLAANPAAFHPIQGQKSATCPRCYVLLTAADCTFCLLESRARIYQCCQMKLW